MRSLPLSVRFKREVVAIGTVVTFFAFYLPFADEPWSIYAALCAAYTIVVFGMLWSDGSWKRKIGANKRPGRDLVQGHVVFLLVLALWIWVCRLARPWLPNWFYSLGVGEATLYLVVSALGIVAIWWAEQGWLAKAPRLPEGIGPSAQ
jgi:hypothetical protein